MWVLRKEVMKTKTKQNKNNLRSAIMNYGLPQTHLCKNQNESSLFFNHGSNSQANQWWTEQGLNLLFTYCLKAFRFWVENPKK